MKYLKKINKGFALTIIVILILVIYIISVEAKRSASKPDIEKACKEYIEIINKYAVLPEDKQKLKNTQNLNKEEIEKVKEENKKAINEQMDKIEKELKAEMIENELAVKMQKEQIEEFLSNQNDMATSFVTKYNKEIVKIKKFVFDEDQVTVTFNSKTEKEVKYFDTLEEKELSKKEDSNAQEETITLQNINGSWKVVYADLQYQDASAGFSVMQMGY